MKRWKPIFAILCVAVLTACTAMFAACFGDKDTTEYYAVTVAPYDGEKGSVEVSAPAKSKGYVKDEQVTVTVTPAQNCVVEEMTVNDVAVLLNGGKYTFNVQGDTVVYAAFEYVGWANIAWHEDTLGTLTFDEDYNMTLTASDGTAQDVVILTPGIDLSEGLPKVEISVRVGNTAYGVSFGTFLTFTAGYTEYIFDSAAVSDFSDYAGTWKQYRSNNTLTVTAAGLTYLGRTYGEYYTAFDGSHYVKYRAPADPTEPELDPKPQRYLFGYLDNEKKVVYFDFRNGNAFYFTADGSLPTAAFPAEFYGAWWNETYYSLDITSSGATIDESGVLYAFAVSGTGKDAVVYFYYNNLLWTMYMRYNAVTGKNEIVMHQQNNVVFAAVEPVALPIEYRGEWTELDGTKTVSVDGEGQLAYEGKTRETTRDLHDFGFHFITDAGKKATVMYFEHGTVLALDDGDGHIVYYKKGELTGIAAASVPAGTWTAGEGTLTVSADKKIAFAEGGAAAKEVLLVFAEDVTMDDVPRYNGEAIYNGVYWEFDFNKTTHTITLTRYTDLARRTTQSIAFTQAAE